MTPLNSSLETLFVDNVLRLPPDNPDPTAPPAIATSLLDSSSLDERDSLAVDRTVVRTPSPTPSEAVVYSNSWIFLDWRKYINWRYWIKGRRKWLLVPLPFVAAFVALVSIYHDDIVRFLTPVANWMHDTKGGFMIPISVLFILSFPPLWGHEVVALVCGLVWGLWIGFGIVSAGTFIGEIGNFYAFRYCLRPRCEKWEKTKIAYACLTRVVREGGFRVVLIARYSAIPPHFTTAVFSTCGVGIVSFSLAAILSLPRQLLNVYLGVIFLQTSEGGQSDKKITWPLAIGTILTTIVAMWYILWKMKNVRPEVIYARRKARQQKAESSTTDMYSLNSLPYLPEVNASVQGRLSRNIELNASKTSLRVSTSARHSQNNDPIETSAAILSPTLHHIFQAV